MHKNKTKIKYTPRASINTPMCYPDALKHPPNGPMGHILNKQHLLYKEVFADD